MSSPRTLFAPTENRVRSARVPLRYANVFFFLFYSHSCTEHLAEFFATYSSLCFLPLENWRMQQNDLHAVPHLLLLPLRCVAAEGQAVRTLWRGRFQVPPPHTIELFALRSAHRKIPFFYCVNRWFFCVIHLLLSLGKTRLVFYFLPCTCARTLTDCDFIFLFRADDQCACPII